MQGFAAAALVIMENERGSNNMKIMPNRLDKSFFLYQDEYERKALEVLRSGWYVLGREVQYFEQEFARYLGAGYCVGLASGLDALWIAFRILGIGIGDEVIVQGNTYIASVMGITINGAIPIFVEPDEYFNIDAAAIEEKITEKTRAILVVHLYGQASNMKEIMRIAKKYGLKVIEDCAQSHGAAFDGKMTGTFGDIGCFSFYPTKNLGCFGDGGAVITNHKEIADKIRIFRNYGSQKRYFNKVVGTNSRLDELQAGLLRVRLSHMAELKERRMAICQRYLEGISNKRIVLPQIRSGAEHIWHQFVVRTRQRKEFMGYLDGKGVGTAIHYPVPPHLSEAYQYLGLHKGSLPVTEKYADEVVSLPLYDGMTEEEADYVIDVVNGFHGTDEGEG